MSNSKQKSWFRVAITEILIYCLPLVALTFINVEKRDFALIISSFVLLTVLFVGYIFLKNYQCKEK